jgi:P27 family predicted phage terminase small subunit
MSKRPDPIEKRIAKGNTSRRPLPTAAPGRAIAGPVAPPWLAGPALDMWRHLQAILMPRGQWSADSELALMALCTTWAEYVELADDIRRNGRFQSVRTKASSAAPASNAQIYGFEPPLHRMDDAACMERIRPAVAAYQDADRRLKGWLIEFGLTDASRAKAPAPPVPPAGDALARYGLQ